MNGPIYQKSHEFSLEVLKLYKVLQNQKEIVISKQLLAAATSVGANIHEASGANSRKDFINKMVMQVKKRGRHIIGLSLSGMVTWLNTNWIH